MATTYNAFQIGFSDQQNLMEISDLNNIYLSNDCLNVTK